MSDHFKGWQDGHLPPPEIPEQEPAEQIKEGGGQVLNINNIADGEYLLRSGTDILSNDLISYIAGEVSPVKIVAVKSAILAGTQTASLAANTFINVTNLSVVHAAKKSSNRILLLAQIGTYASSASRAQLGFAFAANGSQINLGTASGNRGRVSIGPNLPTDGGAYVSMPGHMSYLYSPSSTSSITYTVVARTLADVTNTIYINRSQDDGNVSYRPRALSSFILIEVE